MREILFRGKRLDNGQWVYGYLVKRPSPIQMPEYGGPWYIDVPPKDPDDHGGTYNVDPDTVGQYTGLHDINNKPIYENDILKKDFGSDQIGVQYAFVYYSKEYSGFMTKPVNDWMFTKSSDCKVVGNIHDNRDLLEEKV